MTKSMKKITEEIIMSNYKLPRLPKSSKRLIAVLADKGQLTQKELIQAVGMPAKTVRYALKRLSEVGLIVTTPNLQDMRSNFYQLSPDVPFSLMEQHIEQAQKLVRKESIKN
jgi:DNA-binding MarR family transcriptional regulator